MTKNVNCPMMKGVRSTLNICAQKMSEILDLKMRIPKVLSSLTSSSMLFVQTDHTSRGSRMASLIVHQNCAQMYHYSSNIEE